MADIATIGILQQRTIHRDEILYEQLVATLHHRTVVEQAKGVLAELGDLDMHQACTALRGYARTHQLLSEVARDVATGDLDGNGLVATQPAPTTRSPAPD
ncbi:ANTAR domain-containing protein [Tenggerimyces flavus]|uniref:ANTAR domain-containing protein n=1 Tax=Tenggerimyces flavus TaxID=1708749 RepID=A0ABV7YDB8_9ACTN|nr:ANTAR domain-containing protein [Tenggerimyces flavus]MBM7790285.1 AmiR/NasT family two-component response regulator [Tenggerimyces flavus]